MRKNVFIYWSQLALITMLACTSTDRPAQPPKATERRMAEVGPETSRHCEEIVWQDYNSNRYVYRFDSSQRLNRCTALEQTSSYGTYAFDQQLTYATDGLLAQVSAEGDSSRYTYQNGRLASIDFFQEGQPVYRYLVSVNDGGQIVGLRGLALNDSGLLAYSVQYQLDEQGRYVQLDMQNDRGVLCYRVIQRDFVAQSRHPYGFMRGIPYDLNRYPWITWGEGFPLSRHLARHIETYRYAAPEKPTELIRRADVSVAFQTDKQGYVTGQFSTDALTTIRDTVLINYVTCH